MRRLSRFRELSTPYQTRLVVAVLLLVTVSVGITVVSFSRLREALVRATATGGSWLPGSPPPERVAWAVDVADRHVPGSRSCLMRSLAAEALLRLDGYEPQHRIGVDRSGDGAIEAHSWLEYEGVVLIGDLDDLSQYDPLPPLDERDQS